MIPLLIHRTDADDNEYPMRVWVEYMVCDEQAYGVVAWDGARAVTLTASEENEALERIYLEMEYA